MNISFVEEEKQLNFEKIFTFNFDEIKFKSFSVYTFDDEGFALYGGGNAELVKIWKYKNFSKDL